MKEIGIVGNGMGMMIMGLKRRNEWVKAYLSRSRPGCERHKVTLVHRMFLYAQALLFPSTDCQHTSFPSPRTSIRIDSLN